MTNGRELEARTSVSCLYMELRAGCQPLAAGYSIITLWYLNRAAGGAMSGQTVCRERIGLPELDQKIPLI